MSCSNCSLESTKEQNFCSNCGGSLAKFKNNLNTNESEEFKKNIKSNNMKNSSIYEVVFPLWDLKLTIGCGLSTMLLLNAGAVIWSILFGLLTYISSKDLIKKYNLYKTQKDADKDFFDNLAEEYKKQALEKKDNKTN